MFFDQIDTMHKNLQKGLERWLENDLQQRGCMNDSYQRNLYKNQRLIKAKY